MMKITVLMVNYNDEAQKLYIPLLSANGISAHSVSTMTEALIMLVDNEYSCVVINGDHFDYLPLLKVMRKITAAPIGVSISHYDPEENYAAIKSGADIFRVRYDDADSRVERFASFVKISIEYNNGLREPITVLTHDDLQVYPHTRKVYVKDLEVLMLGKEFDILYFLMINKGIVLSYERIFLHVWGDEYADNVKERLWNHISRLRRKLRTDPELPEYILTERNYGYSFSPRKKGK